ncbi:DUF1453 domain-containing protein [Streptomyces sp. NPDC087850]|uniref:DUF1453 domain-containing protein n=1 Tax=Streptomyces sp. NPDC087850 TaxID=3365809 RepID=UPI0037FF5BB3
MSLVNVLVIVGVIALIAVRQSKPQRIATEGRGWLVLPVILVVAALREPGVIDGHDQALSALLLGAELVVGLVVGLGWAWTSRIWAEPDGTVWSKGTRATAAVWAGGIAVRVGMVAAGALLGVHQGTGALLLALAASILVRRGVLVWRAHAIGSSNGPGPSYGDRAAAEPWKDRV